MSKLSRSFLALIQAHFQAMQFSLKSLVVTPSASFMMIAVIAIALALPTSLYCVLSNVTRLCDHWYPSNQISLYLKSDAKLRSIIEQVRTMPAVQTVDYISPSRGLAEFEKALGIENLLVGLDHNPIPPTIQIHPKPMLTDAKQLHALKLQLEQLYGVDNAKLDTQWVQRLGYILQFSERALLALATIFALAVILVISNTIRLNIENQKQEIEVMSLVGATHPYIRRPFLYYGLFYGGLSGAFAWAWVNLFVAWLQPPAHELSVLYHSTFQLKGLDLNEGAILVFLSGLLGLIAAVLVVHKHLNRIEFGLE